MLSGLPKYTHRDVDRHGVTRIYFKRQGQGKRRLFAEPGTPKFDREYAAALAASEATTARREATRDVEPPAPTGTLRWLCKRYMKAPAFLELDPRTRHVRRLVIGHCLREPIAPDAPERFGDFPLDRMTVKAVKILRDRKRAFPHSANARVQALRQVYAWAIEDELTDAITFNPARDVAYLKGKPGGFHAWTIDEVEAFEAVHPVGTQARLAFALLLYTGQRRSDMVRFGRQHVRDGWLSFTQFKNRNRAPVRLEIPIIPELQRIIDASPTGDLTFLVTQLGQPFTSNGFGNRMRKWCDEAGLPDCSAHGLRKAAVARLAELGCTDREIMAITGHQTVKEVDRYAKGVRQRALAASVLRKVEAAGD